MRLLRQEDGNAMIEFSLVLPVMVLMLIGVVDLGLVLEQAMIVADSARAGAEFAVPWANATNTTGMVAVATQSAGSVPGYSAVAANVCRCTPGGSAVSCSNRCANGAAPAEYAQVTASATVPLIFGIQGLPAAIPLSSTAEVRTTWTGPN